MGAVTTALLVLFANGQKYMPIPRTLNHYGAQMAVAELELQTSSQNPQSFFFKAIDAGTQLTVVAGSKDRAKQVADAMEGPGLYILQAEDTTVYVGQSKELAKRLANHRTNNKIGFTKIMAMSHGATFLRYLDYAEARLYQILLDLGYQLEQSPLKNSITAKKQRMGTLADSHAEEADKIINSFLSYSVAFGLAEPAPVRMSSDIPLRLSPAQSIIENADTAAAKEHEPLPRVVPKHKKLRVSIPGQPVIQEEVVTDTFFRAIQLVGPAKVANLGLNLSGQPLVSTEKHSKYPWASRVLSDGYFLTTHSNTETKLLLLRRISKALALGWLCELVG